VAGSIMPGKVPPGRHRIAHHGDRPGRGESIHGVALRCGFTKNGGGG
jgi:hypothetical protein